MGKWIAFLLSIMGLFAIGCASGTHHSDTAWTTSPQGYKVCFDDAGTVSTGRATLEQIYSWHAQAVDRASYELAAKGVSRLAVLERAKTAAWRLVDNHSFQFGNIYAAGDYVNAANTIKVCLYVQMTAPGPEFVPKDAPAWTVRKSYNSPGIWVYGTLPDGKWFPAAANELGHAMGLPGEY